MAGLRYGGAECVEGEALSSAGFLRGRRMSVPVVAGTVRCLDTLLLFLAGVAVSPMAQDAAARLSGAAVLVVLLGTGIACSVLGRLDLYAFATLQCLGRQARGIGLGVLAACLALVACLTLAGSDGRDLRPFALAWSAVGAAGLLALRAGLCPMVGRWAASGRLSRRVAVVGVSDHSATFVERLKSEPQAWEIVGIYDDRLSRVPAVHAGISVLGTVDDLVNRSRVDKIDVIVVALPLAAVERIAHILQQVGSAVADICLTTDLAGMHYAGRQFRGVGANAVVSIKEEPLKDWRAVKKVAFDRALASALLVLAIPLMTAIAVAIRLDSPGPVLFRQPRLGFNNRMFTCLKFRTMHQAATDRLADRQTVRGDPRVTRVGRFLRRFSLDELPQLVNVLRGTMSLVGPRPHAPNTRAADRPFAEVVAHYAVRHRVKPGITGWAQVNGWRGETRTAAHIENRVAHDLHYIENWSLLLDLRILLLTVTREIWSSRAY